MGPQQIEIKGARLTCRATGAPALIIALTVGVVVVSGVWAVLAKTVGVTTIGAPPEIKRQLPIGSDSVATLEASPKTESLQSQRKVTRKKQVPAAKHTWSFDW